MLINQDDIQKVRRCATIDDDKFNAYVLEVERTTLRPLLGVALYEKVVADPSAYAELMDGVAFGEDSYFDGVAMYLSYRFFQRLAEEGDIAWTSQGGVDYDDEYSNKAQVNNVAKAMQDRAEQIGDDMVEYLKSIGETKSKPQEVEAGETWFIA